MKWHYYMSFVNMAFGVMYPKKRHTWKFENYPNNYENMNIFKPQPAILLSLKLIISKIPKIFPNGEKHMSEIRKCHCKRC